MVTMMRLLAAVSVIVAAGALAVGTATGAGAGTAPAAAAATLHGTWQKLPAAPVTRQPVGMVSVWTGREMIIHGSYQSAGMITGGVTFAYRPATRTWVRLPDGPRPMNLQTPDVAAWTGTRMLVVGLTNGSYNPAANAWRKIAGPTMSMSDAVTGSTGRQFLAWGGTCCGETTTRDGISYNPVSNTWTKLPPAPFEPRGRARGAWTGKELVVAGGFTEPGTSSSALRGGAAYNPATGKWRKIALLPGTFTYPYGPAVWDGREMLFLNNSSARGLAYNPATNRWRNLPVMPLPRGGFAAVWTGHYVLVWGGLSGPGNQPPAHGEAYNPVTNQWTALPAAPIGGRADPVAVWTGRQMIAWGGAKGTTAYTDGAAFTPR
jgi:hypothetical protein